jgi:hypothetical protein
MYEEKKKSAERNKQKQNFHLNVNKRPLKNKKQPSFKERTKQIL